MYICPCIGTVQRSIQQRRSEHIDGDTSHGIVRHCWTYTQTGSERIYAILRSPNIAGRLHIEFVLGTFRLMKGALTDDQLWPGTTFKRENAYTQWRWRLSIRPTNSVNTLLTSYSSFARMSTSTFIAYMYELNGRNERNCFFSTQVSYAVSLWMSSQHDGIAQNSDTYTHTYAQSIFQQI